MNILTILTWLKSHYKIAAKAILSLSAALLLIYGITLYKTNKKLSESLEIAQNNIEAYQGSLNDSQQANNVLKLDMNKLSEQNDKLIQQIDSVRKINKIKSSTNKKKYIKDIDFINKIKGGNNADNKQKDKIKEIIIELDNIIKILKDTVYTDTLQYNNLTKVYYSIGTDSVNIALDVKNTQYLYIFKTREYKNKKNFFKRLFTLDFKKVNKYKYKIVNTNNLLKEDSVRIIEQQ